MEKITKTKRIYTKLGKKWLEVTIAITIYWVISLCGLLRNSFMYNTFLVEQIIGFFYVFLLYPLWSNLFEDNKLSYKIKLEMKGVRVN